MRSPSSGLPPLLAVVAIGARCRRAAFLRQASGTLVLSMLMGMACSETTSSPLDAAGDSRPDTLRARDGASDRPKVSAADLPSGDSIPADAGPFVCGNDAGSNGKGGPPGGWAVTASALGGRASVFAIAVDGDGNSYVTGVFEGKVAFGPYTLQGAPLVPSVVANTAFVAKLTPSGAFEWAVAPWAVGSSGAKAVAVDCHGDVYVSAGQGTNGAFIAKLKSSTGKVLWATPGKGCSAASIEVDSQGHSHIAGSMTGTVTLGGTTLTSKGKRDICVAETDAYGNWLWGLSGGSPVEDEAHGIALDVSTGERVVTGYFQDMAALGPFALASKGLPDVFVARVKGKTVDWVATAGGLSSEMGMAVDIDSKHNAVVTGHFNGTVGFGATTLVSSGENDVFVARLGPQGGFSWATGLGGTTADYPVALRLDAADNAWVTGYLSTQATFGPTTLVSKGGTDVLVLKVGPTGSVLGALSAGGTGHDKGFSVALDPASHVYIGGYLRSTTAVFGGTTLGAKGESDPFVWKIAAGTL